ncbi:MAG: Crp/Fnr family transcriptional regulator [Nitrospirae bacterium]|nr:Crp/Fnr family transcriptional regulator [Nitrospirota bacterium]
MTQEKSKLWYLRNLEICAQMGDAGHTLIHDNSDMKDIKKGESLYMQGSADRNIYILKTGTVKMTKLSPQGKEIILDIVNKGSIFGEMTYTEPRERNESAVAMEDSVICIISKQNFDKLLDMIPGLSIQFTKIFGKRRWKIENRLFDLLYSTVEQRLAKTLLNLLDEHSVPHDHGKRLTIKLTHQDFADLIASTRETVTATLNTLRERELINYEGRHIVVTNAAKLRNLAEQQ